MGMKYRMREGSMTVEASLVLPLVLGVLCFLIYVGLCGYDRCLLQAVGGEAAVFSAHEARIGQKIGAGEMGSTAQVLIDGKMVFFTGQAADGSIGKEASLTLSANRSTPAIRAMTRILGSPGWTAGAVCSHTAESPEEKLRLAMAVIKWKGELTE